MQFWIAFVLGLAGSLHCVGMCGPLLWALAKARPMTSMRAMGCVNYHLGRMVSYGLLGAVCGFLGHVVAAGGFQRWLSLGLGCLLLGGVLASAKTPWRAPLMQWVRLWQRGMRRLTQWSSLAAQPVLGALNGLLPCGLVYVAAAGAATTQHPLAGAAYMGCFGLGTWPLLLGVQFAGHRLGWPARLSPGQVSRVAVVAMAALLILRGLELGIPFLSPTVANSCDGHPSCH